MTKHLYILCYSEKHKNKEVNGKKEEEASEEKQETTKTTEDKEEESNSNKTTTEKIATPVTKAKPQRTQRTAAKTTAAAKEANTAEAEVKE